MEGFLAWRFIRGGLKPTRKTKPPTWRLIAVVCGYCIIATFLLLPSRLFSDSFGFKGGSVQGFAVYINGAPTTASTSMTPDLPIVAEFKHGSAKLAAVVMRHPEDTRRSIRYRGTDKVRLTNHEQHMRQGHVSTSEFVAIDEDGNVVGRILITFAP